MGRDGPHHGTRHGDSVRGDKDTPHHTWVPSLTGEAGHPLDGTDLLVDDGWVRYDLRGWESGPIRVVLRLEDGDRDMEVRLTEGFLVTDPPEGVEPVRAGMYASLVLRSLKNRFHTNTTHVPGQDLDSVVSEDLRGAVRATSRLIVHRCTVNVDLFRHVDDVQELHMLYLETHGLVEYGLAFHRTYADILGRYEHGQVEVLTAHRMVLDKLYSGMRDRISDETASANLDMAVSSEALSVSMQALSRYVLGLTLFSTTMSLGSFLYVVPGFPDWVVPVLFGVGALAGIRCLLPEIRSAWRSLRRVGTGPSVRDPVADEPAGVQADER